MREESLSSGKGRDRRQAVSPVMLQVHAMSMRLEVGEIFFIIYLLGSYLYTVTHINYDILFFHLPTEIVLTYFNTKNYRISV